MIPLVFLPGMMCDMRLFGQQAHVLSRGRSVIFGDVASHSTIADIAAHVLRDAPQVFALAGLSMGGIVAMEIVRQVPERVSRLALLDTNPLAELPEVQAGRAAQIARADSGALKAMMIDTFIPRYLAKPDPKIEALCLDMALGLGPDIFARQSRALRDRQDQCDTLRRYAGKTLILCGAQDQLCPPERHALMSELMPLATRVVVDDAGHLPTLEQPEIVTEALKQWLS